MKILSRSYGYHGVTMAAMSATSLPGYQKMFGPMVPNFHQVLPPYPYRWPGNGDAGIGAADAAEEAILQYGADTVAAIMNALENGNPDEAIRAGLDSRDFVARCLSYALHHREKSLSDALMRASSQEMVRYTRGISLLDTVVTMAPLLGLLGTVTGMISAFGMLGGSELGAPTAITGGIAEALIATTFGLGIAVTALIPLNFLHARCESARHEMEDAMSHLELLMKPIAADESARKLAVATAGSDSAGGGR